MKYSQSPLTFEFWLFVTYCKSLLSQNANSIHCKKMVNAEVCTFAIISIANWELFFYVYFDWTFVYYIPYTAGLLPMDDISIDINCDDGDFHARLIVQMHLLFIHHEIFGTNTVWLIACRANSHTN